MKKTNLAKNTILLSIGMIMTKGINLLMIPLFSSWLSTEDYGAFDLYCTYISLLIPFISFASSEAIFRFAIEKETKKEKSEYITAGLMINLVNAMVICGVIGVIGIFKRWDYTFPFVFLLIVELFNNHLQGFMRSTKQLNIYSVSSVISTVGIALFVSILILKFELGLKGMILGYAFGYLLGEIIIVCLTNYMSYVKIKSFSLIKVKEMIKYAYPLIPNNISWWIINVSDRTLINIFLGGSANGIYAIAYKIPNFCASVLNVFNISWQEAAIELVESEARNKYFNKVFNNTISTMISVCGGVVSLNYFLFNYVFDIRYYEAKYYCPILVTSVVFGSLLYFFGGIQISLKRPKENGITTVIGAFANIIINVVLIKYIGLYAAALSTLLSNMIVCLIRYIRIKKDIRFIIDKATSIYILYYLYLVFMAYCSNNILISCINVGIASVMFIIINRDFVLKFLRKMNLLQAH